MNRTLKLAVPLMLLVLCMALSGASAQQVAINAEDGTDLPGSILVGETFTVLITEDGNPVGAGTNVVFTLPASGGDPIYVPTDSNGKARYKPLLTGILGIKVLDDTSTVAEATVTVGDTEPEQILASVEISPDYADLVMGQTLLFETVCNDTSGDPITDGCTLTWACDRHLVGTINSSGIFTAEGVGTATVTVTATYDDVTKSDTAVVDVSGSTEQVSVDGDNFSEVSIDAGTAVINMSGQFDHSVTGSINITPIANPEKNVSSYAFTGDDRVLLGIVATPDANVTDELANDGDVIHLEICYNATELARLNIDPATLAIWRFDDARGWVKMVKDTPPCVDNGRAETCVWVDLTNLSVFALVSSRPAGPGDRIGTITSSGSGSGTYPPGWFDDEPPTPAPTATPEKTATPAPTEAKPLVTTPADVETVTPAAEGEATAEETETAKMRTPGFGAVFMIAGLLAAVYLVLRRRE